MAGYLLSAKEIICLAAKMGATELYGVPDEFASTPQSSIGRELLVIQDELVSKGYISEDFIGNSTIDKDIVALLSLCIHCDKFIMVDRQMPGVITGRTVVYIKGDQAVKLSPAKGEYAISQLKPQEVTEELLGLIETKSSITQSTYSFIIKNAVLAKAKLLKDRHADAAADDLLVENGVPNEITNVIINAFGGNSEFYTYTFTNLNASEDRVENVMFVRYDDIAFMLNTYMENEVDYTKFESVGYKEFTSVIRNLLSKATC